MIAQSALAGAIAAIGLLAAAPAAAQTPPAAACAALAGAAVEAGRIGLPTTGAVVTSAVLTESPVHGQYCKVLGAIHPVDKGAPDIRFQLNLPTAWNRKAVQMGGGGYNGVVVTGEDTRWPGPDQASAIRQGYATFGSDSGHQAREGEDPAAFMLNEEAWNNFAKDQLKKTHDVAKALIARRYGAAPARQYFSGGSQGGHEGFLVIQNWPQDYDGVVAFYPVYDLTALQLNGVLVGQSLYNTPGAWMSPDKMAMLHDAVVGACDGLDGAKDGLIGHVKACNGAFRPETLRCPTGGEGALCLSDAQIAFVKGFASPRKLGVDLVGVDTFAGWPILEGADMLRFSLGKGPRPSTPPSQATDATVYFMGDQLTRYAVLGDAKADTLTFKPAEHVAQLQASARATDASNPDISAFQARGGKLLLVHGTIDVAVTPHNTMAYWERVKARFGEGPLRRFARFFVVPGFGHGDGSFVVGWDALATLDAWVDKGTAPDNQVATDTAKATAGRTRPLCEYPSWPKYRGTGDVNAAASFACATE